jgi:MFS family permease
MVAEMVSEKELQPKAFSIMPLVWSLGSIFGPAFGGFFAQPAMRFPGLFGDSKFFKAYPFALPNFVACVFFFISFMTGLLFLQVCVLAHLIQICSSRHWRCGEVVTDGNQETLESKRHKKDWGLALGEKLTRPFHRRKSSRQPRLSFCDAEASAPLLAGGNARDYMSTSTPTSSKNTRDARTSVMHPPTMAELFTNQTVINLVSYTFLALHSVAYDQALPVFLNYPVLDRDHADIQLPFKFAGGFGLSSDKIGSIFTLYGIACGLIQFQLFPWLCARFGVLHCFRVSTMVFPLVYLVTPFTALIADDRNRYIALLLLMLVKGFVVIIGFPCTTILLTNSASSLRILGTLNGFATAFSGLGRAIGPAITGSTFTWGVQRGYVIAPWWLLAGIAALGAVPSWFIVEGEGPHRNSEPDSEDETLLSSSDDSGVDEAAFALDDDDQAHSVKSRGDGKR